MYIYRELLDKIRPIFAEKFPAGLIISGVVGSGKTTLIEKFLDDVKDQFEIFSYSGDDVAFRRQIANDSNYLVNEVKSKTTKKSIIFVDEIQKSEEIFDALKIAFDKGKISFIVSGSNPAYLSTVAKKRLQRRADQLLLSSISLGEIGIWNNWFDYSSLEKFQSLLWNTSNLKEVMLPEISLLPDYRDTISNYFITGGLPLAFLAHNRESALREIKLTVERGFDLFSKENNSIADVVRYELSLLHSMEFTYKNVFDLARIRKRDVVNDIIDNLINHAYLVKKRPLLFYPGKTSYLSVFSFIDPGIVTYLSGVSEINSNIGQRVEGYVHAKLTYMIYNSVYKSTLSYYKPHHLDSNKNIRYTPGEIDFLIQYGKRMVPIEVKATNNIGDTDTSLMETFIKQHKLNFGIILYQGAPFIEYKSKIIFWPYFMI